MDGMSAIKKFDIVKSLKEDEIAESIMQLDPGRSAEMKLADAKGYVNQGKYQEAMAEYIGLIDERTAKAMSGAREMLKGISDTKILINLASYCETKGETGLPGALIIRGMMSHNGYGCKLDSIEAAKYFQKAHDKGSLRGTLYIGTMYFKGEGVDEDLIKAHDYWKSAAEQGCADAQGNLGCMYEKGCGVDKDPVKAFQYFKAAADQGHAGAQYNLGCMYENGRGVDKDLEKAFQYYKAAAAQGHASAHYNLGGMYQKGWGVVKNEKEAVKCYKAAADQGYAGAQYNVGCMYLNGRGVDKDLEKAFQYYKAAAAQGHAGAQHNLGCMYQHGLGVIRDIVKAVDCLKKASEKEIKPAFDQLLRMCLEGTVKEIDPILNLDILEKAANLGNAVAKAKFAEEAYAYGYNLQMGKGVAQDLAQARRYYEKSDDHGYHLAPAALLFLLEAEKNVKNEPAIYRLYKRSFNQGYPGVFSKLIELSSNELVKKEDAVFLSCLLNHYAGLGYLPAIHKLNEMMLSSRSGASVTDPIFIKIEEEV